MWKLIIKRGNSQSPWSKYIHRYFWKSIHRSFILFLIKPNPKINWSLLLSKCVNKQNENTENRNTFCPFSNWVGIGKSGKTIDLFFFILVVETEKSPYFIFLALVLFKISMNKMIHRFLQVVPFSAKYCDPPPAFQAGPRLLGGPTSGVWPLCELYAATSFHSCSLFYLQTPTGFFFLPSHPRGGSGSGIIWIMTPINWHFSWYCLLPGRKEKEAGCGCIQLRW